MVYEKKDLKATEISGTQNFPTEKGPVHSHHPVRISCSCQPASARATNDMFPTGRRHKSQRENAQTVGKKPKAG